MAEKKAAAKKTPKPNADKSKAGRPKEVGKVTERSLSKPELSMLTQAAKRSGKTTEEAIVAIVKSRLADRSGPITLSVLIDRWSR